MSATATDPVTGQPRTYEQGYQDGLAAHAAEAAWPRAPAAMPRGDILDQIDRCLGVVDRSEVSPQLSDHARETALVLIRLMESHDWVHTGEDEWTIGEQDREGRYQDLRTRYNILRDRLVEEETK